MVRGESARRRVVGEFPEPQRLRVPDHFAQDPVALGEVTDGPDPLLGESDRHEPGEPVPFLPDDAQRAVLGVHQDHGRPDDMPQDLRQIEFAPDRENGLQQTPRRLGRLPPYGVQTGPQLGRERGRPLRRARGTVGARAAGRAVGHVVGHGSSARSPPDVIPGPATWSRPC